jgi:uncharacterized protein
MIEFAKLSCQLDLSGALFIPDFQALLVADLHFEKGSHFASRGQALPPYDTRQSLSFLQAAIRKFKPHRLIALGDSFHDGKAETRIADEDMTAINQLSDHCDVIWITGNHDEILPRSLKGDIIQSMQLGDIELTHIPSPSHGAAQIAGHLHPMAIVPHKSRPIRARCFAVSEDRLILPAFGAYTGGLNVRSDIFKPIFPNGFAAHLIGNRAIHVFAGEKLKP